MQTRTSSVNPLAARTAPAARGIAWITDGFRYFQRDWVAWLLVTLLLMAITFGSLLLVPVLGYITAFLLTPVFLGSLMQGVAARDQGRPLAVNDLFTAFQGPATGQLLLVGLVSLALNLLAVVGALVFVMFFSGAAFLTGLAQSEDMLAAAMELTFSIGLLIGLLIYVALLIPITMLVWFAPALVVLEGESALAAMQHSFVGCLRNFLPYLVYGLVGLLVFPLLMIVTLGVGFLVLVPVGLASIYAAHKDIFHRP